MRNSPSPLLSPSSQSPLLTASHTSSSSNSDDLEKQSLLNDDDNFLNSSKTRKRKSKFEKYCSLCYKSIPFDFNIRNLNRNFKKLKIPSNNKLLNVLFTLSIVLTVSLLISLIIPVTYIFEGSTKFEYEYENENPSKNLSNIEQNELTESYNSLVIKLLNSSLARLNESYNSLNTNNESSDSDYEIYTPLNDSFDSTNTYDQSFDSTNTYDQSFDSPNTYDESFDSITPFYEFSESEIYKSSDDLSDSLTTLYESSESEIYQSLNDSFIYSNENYSSFEDTASSNNSPSRDWSYLEDDKPFEISDSHLVKLLTSSLNHLNEAPPYKHKDFRLTPALYLNHILNRLNEKNNTLSADIKLPFSWSDWIDFDKRLHPGEEYFLKSNNNPIFSCEQFAEEIGFTSVADLEQDGNKICFDLNEAEVDQLENFYYPHFKMTGHFVSHEINIDARIVHGASYTYHEFSPPKRFVFVDGSKKTDLIIPISNSEPIKNSVLYEITNFDIDEHLGEEENIHKKIEKLIPINELMKLVLKDQFDIYSNDEIIVDFARFSGNRLIDEEGANSHIKLDKSDFQNPNTLNDIRDSLFELDMDNSLDSNLYSNIINEYKKHPDGDYEKYFHESESNDPNVEGSHYDWRFFNYKHLPNEYEKRSTLHRIMKAWLRFTNNENIVSWPNHGTLLGYSFNKYMLPWDSDHDIQVSSSGMWKLAKYFNQSLIIDCTSDEPFSSGYGQYYLDVSGCFFNRSNSNHNNAIDARFVDIQTGMYIDITQLSITKDKELLLNGHFENFYDHIKAQYDRFAKQYPNVREIIEQDELITCKNNHVYSLAELTDFDRDLFEGEYVYIPRSYVKMLDRLFPERKKSWSYKGYTWRSEIGLWLEDERCELGSSDRYGVSCLQNEFNQLLIHLMKGFSTDIETILTIDSPNQHTPSLIFPDWDSVILFDKNEENQGIH